MSVLVMSVSHKTAPLEVLARLALTPPATERLITRLVSSDPIREAIVVSTCNRTEIYVSTERFHSGLMVVADEVAARLAVAREELQDLCSVYFETAAVSHCFSVAAGLDSLVLGESQVIGQVRDALALAQRVGGAGAELNSVFQQALRVAKRVQTDTAVGQAGRSVVSASFDQLARRGVTLNGLHVLVVGAGAMAALAARSAHAAGARVTCINRTVERARRLAAEVAGDALPLTALPEALAATDVVVTCTGARGHVLDKAALQQAPLVRAVVDLALPADADPAIAELGIELVNLDGLADDPQLAGRNDDVAAAEALVRTAVERFEAVRRASSVAPTVVALRALANDIVELEMMRLSSRLPELDDHQHAEMHRSMRRLADKLLHRPTVRVQELSAGSDKVDYAAALRDLFALEATVGETTRPLRPGQA